ncbi:hypothetical protein GS489_02065 [Rhodococcus hoagii]|nr:hypothetical protein [Prescottella equi]MBM4613739.1 hypothetical protein [Prescottella equi]
MSTDSLKWHPSVRVDKYNPETVADLTRFLGHAPTTEDLADITPDDVVVIEGNGLVNAGLERIANLIIGTASTNAFTGGAGGKGLIGVGDSAAAFAATHTDLQGTSKLFVPISAQPTVTAGTGKFTATAQFAASDAVFTWNEWCFAIGTGTTTKSATLATAGGGSAVMLNRKPGSLGAKADGAVWTLTADITLS